jgi:hypothetical protein
MLIYSLRTESRSSSKTSSYAEMAARLCPHQHVSAAVRVRATHKIRQVTFSKQLIHFRRSARS